MDFLELAKNRYSERFFDSRPVEQEKLDYNGPRVKTSNEDLRKHRTVYKAREIW